MSREWRWARPEEWDEFFERSACATAFHSRAWCETYCAYSPRHSARAFVLRLADGREALTPVFVRRGLLRAGPFRRGVSSRPGVYGGPLTRDGALGAEGWKSFFEGLARGPLARWECFGNPLDDPPPEALSRASSQRRSTHWIELAELGEDPLASYDSACRRNVRKAEREGVSVAREHGAAAVAEYFEMYVESQRRWGEDPARGYRVELFEKLLERGCAELWCARTREGRMAAGGLFLASAAHFVYWHGALREEHSSLRPANALHHALIVEAKRRGARAYDFNPSEGLEGVEQFKRSFGARPREFATWTYRA